MTHFRVSCVGCGRDLADGFHAFCPDCGSMSDVDYDPDAVALVASPNPYVRFRDLLPVADRSLLPDDARFTPCVHARRLGRELGLPQLYLKDETGLPTGTTKDRMAAVALPYLYERGVRTFTTSSTGNSSTAYAHAIARLPALRMVVFTASEFRPRLSLGTAENVVDVVLEGATFVETFAAAAEYARRNGLVSETGFFNPGRREGLKVAWLEAAEQVPAPIDWYVQAVSSAMGVYGVHKGAAELQALGRIERAPRLLCVQQESCAPMVAAFLAGAGEIGPEHVVERPTGIASAILRGDPTRTYPHVRRIVSESGGTFVAVSEAEIRAAHRLLAELEGIGTCFAAAAAVAGIARLAADGTVDPAETVLVNLTGSERPGEPETPATHRVRRAPDGWELDALSL